MTKGKNMRKVLSIVVLLLVYSIAISVNPAETGKEPQSSYLQAVDSLKDLDLRLAYKRLAIIIRDFPRSEEARKASLLKAVISASEFSSFDILASKYSEAIQKAKSNDVKKEIIKLYNKISQDKMDSGKNLINDVQILLKDTNKSISLQIKKEYDSLDFANKAFLPVKELEEGRIPSSDEIKNIEDFQKDVSYRYVLGKVLGEGDLISPKTIQKEVDWAETMFLMGNTLVHWGEINKVGWLDPATNKITRSFLQAEKSFLTAKQCFEKAKNLSKDRQFKTKADGRIQEINEVLKEFN